MRDAAGPCARIFDQDMFDGLRAALGADALAPLVETAEAEIAARLGALSGKGPGAGGVEMRRIAHDLAGLAGQVGLTALAQAARELEDAIRQGNAERTAAAKAALLALGPASLEALRAARSDLASA